MDLKRVKMIVSYDGTNYCGWQMQPNGTSIEEILNRHLSELLREEIIVIGASRTDSGVHALGNVAVFDTHTRIPAEKIALALNQRLPADIVIQSSCEVPLTYHPRKCNTRKIYEYRILNRRIPLPAERFNSLFYYMPLNVEHMKQAAAYLIGEHDFVSFCSTRNQAEDTVRTIYSLDIDRQEDMIRIRICGNGFLYNMVRIIVGTLLRVGTGLYTPEHVEEILHGRDRALAGPKVPPEGLTLVAIVPEDTLEPEICIDNRYMDYRLIQQHIEPQGNAFIELHRCVEKDFERTIIRLCKKCARNAADRIYVRDDTGRLKSGDCCGYFTFTTPEELPPEAEGCGWLVTEDTLRKNAAE